MGKLEELEELTKSMKGKMKAMRGFITACGLDSEYATFVKEYDELIAVDQTVILFTEPENLIAYLERAESTLNLSNQDCELLINYMEGHGYSLGESCGMLVRADITEEYGEVMEYSIDDAIDTIREWNDSLLSEIVEQRNAPENFLDFCSSQDKYTSLLEDEKALLKMFDQTTYGKMVNALAEHPVQKNDRSETLNDTKETHQNNANKKEKVR